MGAHRSSARHFACRNDLGGPRRQYILELEVIWRCHCVESGSVQLLRGIEVPVDGRGSGERPTVVVMNQNKVSFLGGRSEQSRAWRREVELSD